MREGIRWLGYFLLVLIVFVAIVFAAYRMRGPSYAQREALALMEKDYKPTQGRNAFVVFRYMQYDVPRTPELVFCTHGRMGRRGCAASGLRCLRTAAPLAEKPSAPRLAEADRDASLLCEAGAPGCLARVTAEPESVRQALATFPTMLARDRVFEQADYYWNEFPRDYRFVINESPDPAQRIWLSAYALRYVDGDHAGAARRHLSEHRYVARRFATAVPLIASMIAIAKADGAMRLLAEMLAALPAGEPVPDECGAALRPIETADIDRCGEMAGEFAMSRSVEDELSRNGASWTDRAETWLMFDARQTQAWRAEQYAQYCGDSAVRRMLDDDAVSPDVALGPVMRRAECVARASPAACSPTSHRRCIPSW